ncbi:uncharacterized protein BDZ99DRAFT_469236 [Mytilinidion resinicola]|uniref:Uncharacterized protein n=1 Tax=Mytilinidion resinicola TaxID=574789 RepID=A0A6A6XZJ5_9PEZI|nr:uncharacterized protein BDZ99DRAFT_469236 [Mytilinidion resinicola]KAF2801942.1 hypothetical protein BDZ99DRAFT_469236 [Mytilinidion resinicola]
MGCDPVFYTDFNSAAAVDYFGFPAPIKFQDKRWKITNTIRNVYNFGNGWWGSSTQIQVFCGDNSMRQPEGSYCTNRPGHVHLVDKYSDDKDGLMFCDSWFRLSTLSGAISEGGLSHEYWNIENYENRARHWINALLMKKNIGTWPTDQTGNGDIARQQFTYPDYGLKWMLTPSAVKWAAKNPVDSIGNLDDRVLKNADTWSWFAMAAYITTKDGGGIYTPAPYVPAGFKFDTVGAFNVTG